MLQRCTRRDSQDFGINSGIAMDQQGRNHPIPMPVFSPRFFQQTASAVLRISIPCAMLAFASQHLLPETGGKIRLRLSFRCKAKLALAELSVAAVL